MKNIIISSDIEKYNWGKKIGEEFISSGINGAVSGAYAARTAEAVAGPTPFKTVSSVTAWEMSGGDWKAF